MSARLRSSILCEYIFVRHEDFQRVFITGRTHSLLPQHVVIDPIEKHCFNVQSLIVNVSSLTTDASSAIPVSVVTIGMWIDYS